MDDLTGQLQALGDAAQAAVPETLPDEVRSQQIDVAPADELLERRPQPSRRSRAWLLAAAAGVVLIALGSIAFVDRSSDDEPAELETATQTDRDSTSAFAVPTDDNGWEQLRFCESSSTYDIDTGNTFYGAYQFTYETFRVTTERLGLTEYVHTNPADAPPEIQDAAANAVYLDRGKDVWPICERFIRGPMITPVVPQWVSQFALGGVTAIVFLNPDIAPERITEIRSEIETIVGPTIAETMTYVNQEEALAEFEEIFIDQPHVRESINAVQMPASFRLRGEIDGRTQMPKLRDLVDVFDVVTPEPYQLLDPPPLAKLSIPALGLRTPVYGTVSLEHLADGAALLAGHTGAPVIAGYGSVEQAVFSQLKELSKDDRIEFTMLQLEAPRQPFPIEATRSYAVTEVTISDVEELPAWVEFDADSLILVADVPDEPRNRIVVRTRPVMPDTAEYGFVDDN